ncbi:cold-shock protein [Aeromonas caviae]|uniref:cold-shock protein n=1 Tax=Aeromonas caviae TaxID=648 RepID=UPI0038CF6889
MTAQVHEGLILDGVKTSMAFCPPLPKDNPRLIELNGNQGLSTACWRGYRGSWEIKGGKFFLTGISGKYQLSDGPSIFANWFTGTIKIPAGDILKYVHGGFSTVYEQEIHITIQEGIVKKNITVDNRPPSPKATNVDYGVVNRYFPDKGFGFVRGLLLGNNSEIFFHIKTIKKTDPQLAESLSRDLFGEKLHFWFDTETTSKGIQICTVFSPRQIRQGAASDTSHLIDRIESYWRNLGRQKPSWLDDVTSDLLGQDRTNELNLGKVRTSP